MELKDKRMLITGGTGGVGMALATCCVDAGAEVIVCDLPNKTPPAGVEFIPSDLSTLEGMNKLTEAFRDRHESLDILINNVGAIYPERLTTADGYERTFALNHLSYFAITLLLLKELAASEAASVINVGSSHYQAGRIQFEDLQFEQKYDMTKAYCQTKLANSLFTLEFDRRYRRAGISMVVVHPGAVDSDFGDSLMGFWKFMWKLSKPLRKSAGDAAGEIFDMLQSSLPQQHSGAYFAGGRPRSVLPKAMDREAAEQLWKISLKLCGWEAEPVQIEKAEQVSGDNG